MLIMVATLLLAIFSIPAYAITITGSSSGTFSGNSAGSSLSNSNHTLNWGGSGLTSTSPYNFSSSTPLNDFRLAELTWYNNWPDGISGVTATWNLTVTFTNPPGGDSDPIFLTITTGFGSLGFEADKIVLDDLSGLIFSLAGVNINDLKYSLGSGGSFNTATRAWSLDEFSTSHLFITADFAAAQTNIPEPGSLLLLGTGLIAIAGFARRRMMK